MDNYAQRDPRIDPESALRDLEKKVHYLITALAAQDMLLDTGTTNVDLPAEVTSDAFEVMQSNWSSTPGQQTLK